MLPCVLRRPAGTGCGVSRQRPQAITAKLRMLQRVALGVRVQRVHPNLVASFPHIAERLGEFERVNLRVEGFAA